MPYLCLPTVLQMDIATKNKLFLPMRQNDQPQNLAFRCLRCSSFIAQVIILSDPRAGAIRAGSELTVLCCLVSSGLSCGTLDGPSGRIFFGTVFFKATIDRYRNIFKDPKRIIFLCGQECFIMTCHCHHQKKKLRKFASQCHGGCYNHLSLHHPVGELQ